MIRTFNGYISADKDFSGIRLNANEGSRGQLNRYPKKRNSDVLQIFTELYGVNEDELMMDRGIDGILEVLFSAFIERGDEVLGLSPTYGMYSILSKMRGARYSEVESDLLDYIITPPKLVLLCRPNNPTGEILKREKVITLIEALPLESLIVIDEAYIEFDEIETLIDLTRKYPNLLVLRTLSKAYSLASLRVGFAIGMPTLIERLIPFQAPYPISGIVLDFLKDNFTVDFISETQKEVERVRAWRKRLSPFFDEAGGNFLYRREQAVIRLYEAFQEAGVLIRYFSSQDAIRVSIGNDQEMNKVEELCKKWL